MIQPGVTSMSTQERREIPAPPESAFMPLPPNQHWQKREGSDTLDHTALC